MAEENLRTSSPEGFAIVAGAAAVAALVVVPIFRYVLSFVGIKV